MFLYGWDYERIRGDNAQACLKDNFSRNASVLMPYSCNYNEGHKNVSDAYMYLLTVQGIELGRMLFNSGQVLIILVTM